MTSEQLEETKAELHVWLGRLGATVQALYEEIETFRAKMEGDEDASAD